MDKVSTFNFNLECQPITGSVTRSWRPIGISVSSSLVPEADARLSSSLPKHFVIRIVPGTTKSFHLNYLRTN